MAISLPKDKGAQQKLLLAIIPVLVFFGYYQLMHGKKKAAGDELQSRLEALETKNAAAKAVALTGGPELQKKLALYEEHMKRLEQLIPKSEEVATLLNGLAERAMDANVDLSLMKPDDSTPGEFYTQQTYEIGIIGNYHDVGQYLSSIASGPRIVTPVELKLQPRPVAEVKREGVGRLNASFKIITYVIPPPPSQAAAPGNPPAKGGAHGSH